MGTLGGGTGVVASGGFDSFVKASNMVSDCLIDVSWELSSSVKGETSDGLARAIVRSDTTRVAASADDSPGMALS